MYSLKRHRLTSPERQRRDAVHLAVHDIPSLALGAGKAARAGVSRLEAIVVLHLIVMSALLLIPACQQVRVTGPRTQSTFNLKNIALAIHVFHDANKRLPFNGTKAAIGSDYTSGSWAFQILPMVDQTPIFNKPDPAGFVSSYMCPGRGRPSVQAGFGPWTDFFLSNYINDPENASKPDNPDKMVTMVGITDGTSNTVFVGHGNISTLDYGAVGGVVGSHNIYAGGSFGTARGGLDWVKGQPLKIILAKDSPNPPNLKTGGWGGPYPQGALMAMGDATVRMFPYTISPQIFGELLTPTGGEKVTLPDA